MKNYSAQEFLEKVLCSDLERLCKSGFPFYAYGILCQGLELVGALFDTQNSFDAKGQSEHRFSRGVREIFHNRKYDKCRNALFEGLRGSLIHQLRPGQLFVLGSTQTGAVAAKHLTMTSDQRIILVIEELIEDFRSRLSVIFREGSKWQSMMDKNKLAAAFLSVDEPETVCEISPGSLETSSLSSRFEDPTWNTYMPACNTYKPSGEV